MGKNVRAFYMGGIAVLVMLIVILCNTIHAKSAAAADLKYWNEYYEAYEQEFVYDLRVLLNEKGYTNAGITMTHTVDGEGNREYTVLLHHYRFEKLDETGEKQFENAVNELAFADERCSFSVVLD